MRPVMRPSAGQPRPQQHPTTVRRRTCPARPAASPQNVRNDRAVKHGRSAPKSAASEAGRVGSGSIGGSPPRRRYQAPPMLLHPRRQINAPRTPATPPVIIAAYRKRIRRPPDPPATTVPATPKLRNTSSDADPAQAPLSLLFLELIGDCVSAVRLHVYAQTSWSGTA